MTALRKELAMVGLHVPRDEALALAQLTTAAEFERALVDGGWVASRNEAHWVLQELKARAQPDAEPRETT